MPYTIRLRRDTASNWGTTVLADGEVGYDTTNNQFRVGNGSSAWSALTPIGAGGAGNLATDTLWDAKGDLVVGNGSNAAAKLPVGTNNYVLTADDSAAYGVAWKAVAGSGTVTSVGLSLPAEFTVSNSPVTGSGTLTAVYANQNANLVFAGPNAGAAATPTFRSLVVADIPDLSATYQQKDATLTALAGVTVGANQVIYSTGADAFAVTGLTTYGRSLIDDGDADTARATLGLGTIATQAASSVAITGGTLENVTVTTGTYSSPVNEAVLIKARKSTTGTITKGQIVYIVGSSGSHMTVELAKANAEATSAYTIGVAATSITNNADGYIMQQGRLTELSTLPTNTYNNGDTIYLSESTAGGYSKTPPDAPNHGVFIGFVINANNGSAGELDVRIQNYQELSELSDVFISGINTDHMLVWDNTQLRWENKSPTDTRSALGLGTVATESTVPINKGGTGQTTATAAFDALAPTTTAGDIIYYNGTDNVRLGIGTAGQVLKVNSGANAPEWGTDNTGGGGGSPGGANTEIQFNESGSFGGDPELTWNTSTKLLTVDGNIQISDQGDLRFADADSSHYVAFQAPTTITSNVTWTLPATDGSADQVLKTNGSGTLGWVTAGSGSGTKTYAVFTPLDNYPPASNFATLDTRNTTSPILVLDFDAGTDESAVFHSIMPEAASLGSGLKIQINWMATTATSGTCRWSAEIERMNTDEDTDDWGTAATAGTATSATSGIITTTVITITTIDSVAAGEPYRLRITRDADGTSGTDDMSGDAELVSVEVRSAS